MSQAIIKKYSQNAFVISFENLDFDSCSVKSYLSAIKSNFRIAMLGDFIIQNTDKISPFLYTEQDFDILGVNNKNGVYFNETLKGKRIKQKYYKVQGGDIFYNPYRVNIGSIGIVPNEFGGKLTSGAYVVFRTNENLNSEFLVLLMKSSFFNDYLRTKTQGSVRENLSFEILQTLQIPLPSLEVQEKILKEIKEYKNKIQALQDFVLNLQNLQNSVLNFALGLQRFEQEKNFPQTFCISFADLGDDWSVSANQLRLFGIKKEQKDINTQNLEILNSQITKLSEFKEQSQESFSNSSLQDFSYSVIASDSEAISNLFDLTTLKSAISTLPTAQKWNTAKLGEAKINKLLQRGKSPKYGNSDIQIIKSGQARGYEEFDFSHKYYVEESFSIDDRKLQKGDILINSTGVGTAGRVTLFNLDGNFLADSHITIFRPNNEILNSKFALYCFAVIGFKNIEKLANGSSGQIELSLETIKQIQIPLPPIEVQNKIVSVIEIIESKIALAKESQKALENANAKILEKYLNA